MSYISEKPFDGECRNVSSWPVFPTKLANDCPPRLFRGVPVFGLFSVLEGENRPFFRCLSDDNGGLGGAVLFVCRGVPSWRGEPVLFCGSR